MNQLPVDSSSDFDSFLDIITNVTRHEDLSKFQSFLKGAAIQLTSSNAVSIILRKGEDCHYLDEESECTLWKGMSFPLTSCISGWCILNAETVAIENILNDKRVPISIYKDKNIISLLVVPIENKDVIGAISVYWSEYHKPSQIEIMKLEALAKVSSLVFDLLKSNSELEDIIRKRTESLETLNQRLVDMAVHDELTALYNRRGFFLMSEQAIKSSYRLKMRCSLIFADIDGLKIVNDNFGHSAGDNMIKIVANILNSHFRKSDIVARLGGDEFVILVFNPDENVELMNNRLQMKFKLLNQTGHLPHEINISLGTILCELKPNTKLDKLISREDKLMYSDKLRKKI